MKPIAIFFLFLFSFFQKSNAQVLDSIPLSLEEYFKMQKKNVLKTSLTAPLFGNYSFSFEHAFRPRRTLEARFSFIYANQYNSESIDGFYFGFGYKFFNSYVIPSQSKRKNSIFRGFYLQPELLLGFINKNKFSPTFIGSGSRRRTPLLKQKINYQVFLTNLGLQVPLFRGVILDIFGGIGIGRDNFPGGGKLFSPQNAAIYHQGILKANPGWSFAGKVGVRLGVLL